MEDLVSRTRCGILHAAPREAGTVPKITSSCAGSTRASIHLQKSLAKRMDCRVKPGNDACGIVPGSAAHRFARATRCVRGASSPDGAKRNPGLTPADPGFRFAPSGLRDLVRREAVEQPVAPGGLQVVLRAAAVGPARGMRRVPRL